MSQSPVLFESDDEFINDNDVTPDVSPHVAEDAPGLENPPAYAKDETCVRNLKSILTGVPPPPNYITPEFDVYDLLSKYYENLSGFTQIETCKNNEEISESSTGTTDLKDTKKKEIENQISLNHADQSADNEKIITPLTEDYKMISWPEISKITYYDIYYNLGTASEELSTLIDKYRERFIGYETCSTFLTRSPMLTASAKKRARRRAWGGYSPGRRLSHLAQRRRTFSSANLSLYSSNSNGKVVLPASISNSKSAVAKKILMVDPRGKNSQKSKSTSRIKDTVRSNVIKPNINVPKRALFQSPDQVAKKSARKEMIKTTPTKTRTSKRALWPSSDKKNKRSAKKVTPKKTVIEDSDDEIPAEELVNKNGKRINHNDDSSQARKKCQKSLNFSSDNLSGNEETSSNSTPLPSVAQQQLQLSQLHKQKMVWAVASSLKQCGVNTSHEFFRPAGTLLFKKCRQIWLQHLAEVKKSDVKRSTSEQMFEIAIKYAPDTIKKLKASTGNVSCLSSEHFVNIKKVRNEEKNKGVGFSKVSDIFFSNVKSSKISCPENKTMEERAKDRSSFTSSKFSVESVDSNSNSLSNLSSDVTFNGNKDNLSTMDVSFNGNKDNLSAMEISNNSEFSNSNTDDSIERNLRHMFEGSSKSNYVNVESTSCSKTNSPKLFDEESQISGFHAISGKVEASEKADCDSNVSEKNTLSKPTEMNINDVEVKECSVKISALDLKFNLNGDMKTCEPVIKNCATDNASAQSAESTHAENEIEPCNMYASPLLSKDVKTYSRDSKSKEQNKENRLFRLAESPVPTSNNDNLTFQFKKFGSCCENLNLFLKKDSSDKATSSKPTTIDFDEAARNVCDIKDLLKK